MAPLLSAPEFRVVGVEQVEPLVIGVGFSERWVAGQHDE